MRRWLIQQVLPLLFSLMPIVAGVLVAAAIPTQARTFYLKNISSMDWLILGLGLALFLLQMLLSWRALRWRGTSFDERPDKLLSNLSQAAEFFPLLGLLGTVAAILQTFSEFKPDREVKADTVIALFAPAITATGSGLFAALINIMPTWIVLIGRERILSLSGETPPARELHKDQTGGPPSDDKQESTTPVRPGTYAGEPPR